MSPDPTPSGACPGRTGRARFARRPRPAACRARCPRPGARRSHPRRKTLRRMAPSPAQKVGAPGGLVDVVVEQVSEHRDGALPRVRVVVGAEERGEPGVVSKARRIRANASSCTATSASTKTSRSPVASRAPSLRAAAGLFSAGVLHNNHLVGPALGCAIASRHASRVAGAFVAGTITERVVTRRIVGPRCRRCALRESTLDLGRGRPGLDGRRRASRVADPRGNAGDDRAGSDIARHDRAGADERPRRRSRTPPRMTAPGADRRAAARRPSAAAPSPPRSAARRPAVVARGRLSLMNITPWPTKTSSSIVTPSQMKVWLWILQRAPMTRRAGSRRTGRSACRRRSCSRRGS